MLSDHVLTLHEDMVLLKASDQETKNDIQGINSRLDGIYTKLKELMGWRSFLLTGGIGAGWGMVQGILHMLGWGTAP